jgi:hypothetical protein
VNLQRSRVLFAPAPKIALQCTLSSGLDWRAQAIGSENAASSCPARETPANQQKSAGSRHMMVLERTLQQSADRHQPVAMRAWRARAQGRADSLNRSKQSVED